MLAIRLSDEIESRLDSLAKQTGRKRVLALSGEIIAFCVRSEMTSLLSLPPRLDIAAKFTTEARYAGFLMPTTGIMVNTD